jgi:hypothetical protein
MKGLRYRPLSLPLAALVLALAAAGCGKNAASSGSSTTSPNPPLSAQAADDIALQFATTLSRQHGVPLSQVGTTSLAALARGEGSATALRRARVESIQTEGGLTWSVVVRFFDAAGNEQPIYNPATTARVVVHAKVRGTLASPEHHAFIGSDRMLDVAGLLPTETTLEIDGAANDTADAAFDAANGSASRHYHLVGAGALTDVRQLKDPAVNPYPLSGTARWAIIVDASSTDHNGTTDAHYDATVLVTFNGTRYPTIEVSEHFRYQMDLETGAIERLPA